MRLRPIVVSCGLLALLTRPAGAQDAGVIADAGPVATDAGLLAPDAAAPRITDREGVLIQRIRRLARLARGEDTLEVPIAVLFPIDLTDEDAVRARRALITARLEELTPFADTSTDAADFEARLSALERRALQLEREFLAQAKALRLARANSDAAKHRALAERAQAERAAKDAAAAAREAEAQSARAEAEARAAVDRTIRALKTHLAAVERARADLAHLESQRSLLSEAEHDAELALTARTRPLILHARAATSTVPPEALYPPLTRALEAALEGLSTALSRLDTPRDGPVIDRSPVPLALSEPTDPAVRSAQAALRRAIAETDGYATELAARETTRRYAALRGWREAAERLRGARFSAVRQLPRAAQVPLRSPLQDGLSNVELEFEYLGLWSQALLRERAHALTRLDAGWADAPHLAWDGVRLLTLLLLLFLFSRRISRLTATIDRYQLISRHTLGWHRRALWLARNVERYGPPLIYLLGIWIAHEWLTHERRWLDLDLVYLLLWWVGVLWLLRVGLASVALWAVTRRRLRLDDEIRAHVHWTSRTLAWVVFGFGLLHDVFVLVLGRGVIYFYAGGALYVALGLVLIAVVQRWREVITAAYLATSPGGRLARLVQAAEARWYGFFVAVAAFGWVLTRSLSRLLQDAFLSLDEVRKALAFIFRKQLERRAEDVAGWSGDFAEFPERLRTAFTTRPLDDEAARVDRFPGLDVFEGRLETWRGSGEGGTYLLRGARGLGKSTWLRRAEQAIGDKLPAKRLDVRRDDGSLFDQLGRRLGAESDVPFADLDALQAHLLSGKRRVLLVDDFHRLLERRLGGFDPLEEMLHLMHSTRKKVFWVLAVDEDAWRFASAARPHRLRFRHEQRLEPWPEGAIRDMLMARAAASGIVHKFEDLVVDAELEHREEALTRASEAYTRLIWDYAGGNPMVAAHFWMRSLVPITGARVRVRLFRAPADQVLESLPDDWSFLLGALAQHETLAADEAARVLAFPEDACAAAIEHMRQDGLLTQLEGSAQMTLDVFWLRAVKRHLRQRHLL